MVTRSFLLFGFFAISTTSFGSNGCTKGSEYEPALCPLRLEKISTIKIDENGATAVAAQDPSIDCSSFRLGTRKIRKFFSKAKVANESDAHHTLDWSPCYASGTLNFTNGKKAHWSINQLRTGSLAMDSDNRLFLYCPTCNFKPFQ